MFKRLRTKIAEEAQRFPIQVGDTPVDNDTSETTSNEVDQQNNSSVSEDLIDLNNTRSPILQPENNQFSINDEDESIGSATNSPSRNQEDTSAGSEVFYSSTPSTLNVDPPKPKSPVSTESPASWIQKWILPSDTESEKEDPQLTEFERTSKEQLIFALQKFRNRTQKYKSRCTEAISAYREVLTEKEKLQRALSDAQDRTLRRVAELREQCQLEQQAKAHLEQNLQMILDEKEQMISVLETKVRLLKEGTDSDRQEASQCESPVSSTDTESNKTSRNESFEDDREEIQALREKIKRQEALLAKCKDTIKSNKERTSQLIDEKNNLLEQLDERNKGQQDFQAQEAEIQADLREELLQMGKKLVELEKQQEENAMAMAETKRNMHEELELREQQLCKLKTELQNMQHEKDLLQKKVEEQDTKYTQLQNEHEEAIQTLKDQLENTEKNMEKERENLMHELSRGKAAALSLVKEECERKVNIVEDEWKGRIEELRQEHEKVLTEKEKKNEKALQKQAEEFRKLVAEKNEEMNLAVAEQSLQKTAAISELDIQKDELQREVEELVTKRMELESQVCSLEEELKNQREDNQKEIDKLMATHNTDMYARMAEIESLKAQHQIDVENLKQELAVTYQMFAKEDKKSNNEDGIQDELKKDIRLLESVPDESLLISERNQSAVLEDLDRYKQQVEELNKLLDDLRVEKMDEEAELKHKLEILECENGKLINDTKALSDLQREKEEICKRLEEVEDSCIKNCKKEVLSLQEECEKLKEECVTTVELRNENKELKNKLDELERDKNEIKCTLQHEFNKLQNEKRNLEEELRRSRIRIELLNQQSPPREPDDEATFLLKEENAMLKEQLQMLETQTFGISHVDNYQNQLTGIKNNYEKKLAEKDQELTSKLKQMVRDFTSQMEQKETEYEKVLSGFIAERGQEVDCKMEKEHQKEIAALEQELYEKNCALEDVADHYSQLFSEKEAELQSYKEKLKEKSKDKNNENIIEANQDTFHTEANDWEDGWMDAEDNTPVPQQIVKPETQSEENENIHCTEQIEYIKTLEASIASLQEEITELRFLLGLTSNSASSLNTNHTTEISLKLPEPTEFEYLRNILYEYMMGKEPMVLAKVIAAVLKFSEKQTHEILQRESARQTQITNKRGES